MFFEASKCQPDNFGFVETPPMIPKASQYCLRFGLMMYADIFPEQMGSLTLYLFQYLQATRQVFHHGGITTTDRNAWREVAVDLFLTNVTMPFGVSYPPVLLIMALFSLLKKTRIANLFQFYLT